MLAAHPLGSPIWRTEPSVLGVNNRIRARLGPVQYSSEQGAPLNQRTAPLRVGRARTRKTRAAGILGAILDSTDLGKWFSFSGRVCVASLSYFSLRTERARQTLRCDN